MESNIDVERPIFNPNRSYLKIIYFLSSHLQYFISFRLEKKCILWRNYAVEIKQAL